ncbi:MAG TPA: ANTAR domain-containing protein [Nocardioides sp.]|nr:ANTAR domain-containing protein [Nocardioides sp.]
MVEQALLGEALLRFARLLVTERPFSDALQDLVDIATAVVGVDGTAIALERGGRLVFATASSDAVTALELIQQRQQAGPGVEAFRSGEPVLAPTAAAFPLRLDDTRLGALDLYTVGPRRWSDDEVRAGEVVAALTTGYLASASRLDSARATAGQLQDALDSRVVIEQAKGILAGERGISVDRAFELLRERARSERMPLREVAHAVVDLGFRP